MSEAWTRGLEPNAPNMIDAPEAVLSLAPWRVERILYDDSGLLVVDKPVHMPVYGGDERLGHGVTERLGELLEAQGRSRKLGVHQRLDQETSGLLVFTTDPARDAELSDALQSRRLKRSYVSVVEHQTKPWPETGTIELRLGVRDGRAFEDPKGKKAVTHFRVLSRSGNRSLIEWRLETGRTHQIRVSALARGAPIVGDILYGGARAHRLMLHAARLEGGPLPRVLESPAPEYFLQALSGAQPSAPSDLRGALLDAATHRSPLLPLTNAFRLVNGDGDGIPGLTVDVYAGFATLNLYDAALVPRAREIADVLLTLGVRGVYQKTRVKADLRGEDHEQLAPGGPFVGEAAPAALTVDEEGLVLQVDLEDGLSTGLFVDQRDNHQKARRLGRGGQMLNLFCYTASFSVAAALSGAKTTSVDLSGKALVRARENFAQNGLDPEAHRFFKEDAMKFLARSVRRGDKYDFIVLDPPSFATVGKGTFSVSSRYGEALTACIKLLAPKGRLLCVTNHRKTTAGALRALARASCEAAGRELLSVKDLPSGHDCPAGAEGPFPSKSILVEMKT